MDTLFVKVTADDTENLKQASDIIKNGGLVAFPTETVYGLGGNGLAGDAVKKIFAAKGRPMDNPLILHICRLSQLDKLVKEITPCAKTLIDNFWPGPMTLIFRKKDIVPYETSGGLNTVAIRFPENKIAQEFIRFCDLPVAAPSANTSGRPSPTKAQHVLEDMNGKIEMILDGGDCEIGLESTVIDVTGENPVICRPGGVTLEQVKKFFPLACYDKHLTEENSADFKPISPGMKYKHYAPDGDLIVLDGDFEKIKQLVLSEKESGFITFDQYRITDSEREFSLGNINSPLDCSHRLFDILRQCDTLKLEKIYSMRPPADGVGFALCNRLFKAAGGKIIKLD